VDRIVHPWRPERAELGGAVRAHLLGPGGGGDQDGDDVGGELDAVALGAGKCLCGGETEIGHGGNPRLRWSDPVRMLPAEWRPAPWIGDGPVTGVERLLDALDARCPLWDLVAVYAGVAAVLVALVARIVEVTR
jgi:hypothetical protein